MIDVLAQEYPVTVACEVLGCARSSYYYQATEPCDEAKLKATIKEEAAKWPTYGYRRITAQLRRQKWLANHKRVQRLMRLMGIQAKVKRRKRRTTNSEHDFPRYPNLVQDLEIVHPDQVWVCDITYIRLRYDFVYLAVIMDLFTRGIRGWHLGRSLDHTLTLTALRRALARYPAPEIHHSDQGVQYAATAYTQVLQDVNVQISMADVGEAWQNGYAERLIRTIKEEEVDLSEYIDYNDVYRQIGRFLDDVYMHKRIHSSLGYLTPAEFEEQWRKEHALALESELKIASKVSNFRGSPQSTYQTGDQIAVKINGNNFDYCCRAHLNPLPQVAKAVARGLASIAVPQEQIVFYEAGGRDDHGFLPYYINAIRQDFPNVRFASTRDSDQDFGAEGTDYDYDDPSAKVEYTGSLSSEWTYLAEVLVQSQHLTNVSLFRDHHWGGEDLVTGALKNHYGSIQARPSHDFQKVGDNNPIADVNSNPHIKDKTRLFITEGLFGTYHGGPRERPQQWLIFPEGTPNSLFFSFDPVAIDSVLADYLIEEHEARDLSYCGHYTLHYAAENPYYSLGIHEHKNPQSGSYSVIDYREVDLDDGQARTIIITAPNGDATWECSIRQQIRWTSSGPVNFVLCSRGALSRRSHDYRQHHFRFYL